MNKFPNDVRLVFLYAMEYDHTGNPSHSTAQSLPESFEWTMREQLPFITRATKLLVMSKKNAVRANKSNHNKSVRYSNSSNTYPMEFMSGIDLPAPKL